MPANQKTFDNLYYLAERPQTGNMNVLLTLPLVARQGDAHLEISHCKAFLKVHHQTSDAFVEMTTVFVDSRLEFHPIGGSSGQRISALSLQ